MGLSTKRGAWFLSAVVLMGCEPALESEADLPTDSLATPFAVVEWDAVRSQVEVAPAVLNPGDTAAFLVVASNSGSTSLSAQNGCAPGLGFQIRVPDGSVVDPYSGLAFDCPRLDSQDLDPGETDSVTWKWAAPTRGGRYVVIGGLAVDGRLVGPSAPVTIDVR